MLLFTKMIDTPRIDKLEDLYWQSDYIDFDALRELERECEQHKKYAMQLECEVLPIADVARFWETEFHIANERAKKAETELEQLKNK
jgi:hypothetical protein